MSRRPHEADMTTPTRLSAANPRALAQRCRFKPAAFMVAARQASSTPMVVDEISGGGGMTSMQLWNSVSGFGEKEQISSAMVPPRSARALATTSRGRPMVRRDAGRVARGGVVSWGVGGVVWFVGHGATKAA